MGVRGEANTQGSSGREEKARKGRHQLMRLSTYSAAVKGGRTPDHTAEPRKLDGFRTGGVHACICACV